MARILIVDDAAFMRGSLKYIMESAGHNVVGEAANGQEALKLYRKHQPDIVIMDILMREMDGLAALGAIKKDDPGAKVIMVSALGIDETKKEAEELGALGYIRKPFKQSEIVDEIAKVLASAG